MHVFKDFLNLKEEINPSLKHESVCRNITRVINTGAKDKYIRKAETKGQRENAKLIVYMQDGDVYELIPNFLQNLLLR